MNHSSMNEAAFIKEKSFHNQEVLKGGPAMKKILVSVITGSVFLPDVLSWRWLCKCGREDDG